MAQQELQENKELFNREILLFRTEITSAGVYLLWDAEVRALYAKKISEMSEGLIKRVNAGSITWSDAAKEAQETRNKIMDFLRTRSTPIGRAMAEKMKKEGKSFNNLIAENAIKMHGNSVQFERLSSSEKNSIYAEIVKSAGRSRSEVTTLAQHLSTAGKGLLVLSVSLSVYNVTIAENKPHAIAREASAQQVQVFLAVLAAECLPG